MRLTCPTCRSVLEVPNGTTALVRCPTCRGVFNPNESQTPEPEAPRRRRPEPPSRRREPPETRPARSFIEEQEARKERNLEKAQALRRQFRTAGLGCKFLWSSYQAYAASLFFVLVYLVLNAVSAGGQGALLYFAFMLAVIHLVGVPIGLIIVLFGPNLSSVKGYAAVGLLFSMLHFPLLLGGTLQNWHRLKKIPSADGATQAVIALVDVPTQIPSLGSYLVNVFYPEYAERLPGFGVLAVLSGVVETLQLLFGMLTLMCLARAGGDDDLGIACLRAAARLLFLIGGLVFGLLIFMAIMIESGALMTRWGVITFVSVWMGARGLVALTLLLPIRRAQEVIEVCESPVLIDEKYR